MVATDSETSSRKLHWICNFTSQQICHQWLVTAQNVQSMKTFLTLKLSQYCKSGSHFSSSKQVATSCIYHWIGNTLSLCLPQVASQRTTAWALPQELCHAKPSGTTFGKDGQTRDRVFKLDSNLNFAALQPHQRVVQVLSDLNSLNKLCRVKILYRTVD